MDLDIKVKPEFMMDDETQFYDELLKARDDLFEKRLIEGTAAHRRLMDLLPK
jgi:hypothetical protein